MSSFRSGAVIRNPWRAHPSELESASRRRDLPDGSLIELPQHLASRPVIFSLKRGLPDSIKLRRSDWNCRDGHGVVPQ
jgi:hypothetical protein